MEKRLPAALALFACLVFTRTASAESRVVSLGGSTTLELLQVPQGRFTQGSPAGEPGRSADEVAREVTISEDFYLGKSSVTVAQFSAFVAATSYRTEAERGTSGGSGWNGSELVQSKEYTWKSPGFLQTNDHPVTLVTYADAEAFAKWFSAMAKLEAALPTEAQWEYAARAGTTTPYSNGSKRENALARGWFKENGGKGTRPVAANTPNAFGFYDMGGNVYEWCRDWYGPYTAGAAVDPMTEQAPAGDTARRVVRGGSWHSEVKNGRSAARYRNTPGSRNADNGFRVAARLAPFGGAADSPSSDPTKAVTSPTKTSGDGMWPVLLIIVGTLLSGGLILGIVLIAIRAGKRGGGASGVGTRIVNDGFWIEGGVPPRARVLYECYVRGSRVSDTVAVDNGRTFVYTGGVPSQIRILDVNSTNPKGPMRPTPDGAPARQAGYRHDSPPQPFRGYPSAY